MDCEALVRRWTGNPDEPERSAEPCGKPAHWRVTAQSTGVGIKVCKRHAGWWRKQTDLRGLVDAIVEPLP